MARGGQSCYQTLHETLKKLMVESQGRRGNESALLSLWDPAQHQIKPTSTCEYTQYVQSSGSQGKEFSLGCFVLWSRMHSVKKERHSNERN